MALLRQKEIPKMSEQDIKTKLSDLKLEIVKANVTANKSSAKTKEIKRAISRILTHMSKNKISKSKDLLKTKKHE